MKTRVSNMHFVILWNKSVGERRAARRRRRVASVSPSVHGEYLTTLIFTFMQRKLRFLAGREKKEKVSRVLPRVELALMRFSCNYFSATTIRTTTTEDLIRQ